MPENPFNWASDAPENLWWGGVRLAVSLALVAALETLPRNFQRISKNLELMSNTRKALHNASTTIQEARRGSADGA